jgi:hypothetical protein
MTTIIRMTFNNINDEFCPGSAIHTALSMFQACPRSYMTRSFLPSTLLPSVGAEVAQLSSAHLIAAEPQPSFISIAGSHHPQKPDQTSQKTVCPDSSPTWTALKVLTVLPAEPLLHLMRRYGDDAAERRKRRRRGRISGILCEMAHG